MLSVVNEVVYNFMYGSQSSLITHRPYDSSFAILHTLPIAKVKKKNCDIVLMRIRVETKRNGSHRMQSI